MLGYELSHLVTSPKIKHTMKSYSITLGLITIAALMLALVVLVKPTYHADGAAFTGAASRLQVATTTVIGPSSPGRTLFSNSADDSCKARVVTTATTSAYILFGEPATAGNLSSTSLTANVGHFQATGTTQIYDSGLVGCGRWTAWSWSTSTVTVSEF